MFEREYRDLAHVPRWTIARVIRRQSVAEHSYFVALYAMQIADLIDRPVDMMGHLLWYALTHDLEECFTGDIPGTTKRSMTDNQGVRHVMWIQNQLRERFGPGIVPTPSEPEQKIVKVANLLDEVMYLAGEQQLGNLSVNALLDNSMDRLEQAWFNLPARKDVLDAGFTKVMFAIQEERYGQSEVVKNNDDLSLRARVHPMANEVSTVRGTETSANSGD